MSFFHHIRKPVFLAGITLLTCFSVITFIKDIKNFRENNLSSFSDELSSPFSLWDHQYKNVSKFQKQQQPSSSSSLLSSSNNNHQKKDDNIIFPKKLYTIIGKESSGTTFVTEIISKGLNPCGYYTDGGIIEIARGKNKKECNKTSTSTAFWRKQQVQHVSLPWGNQCLKNIDHHIVDVVLPIQCMARVKNKLKLCHDVLRLSKTLNNNNNISEVSYSKTSGPTDNLLDDTEEDDFDYLRIPLRYPGRSYEQSSYIQNFTLHDLLPNKIKDAMVRDPTYYQNRKNDSKTNYHNWVKIQQNNSKFNLSTYQTKYPERYFLNITSQKLFYEEYGIEQYVIIVVRDKEMSLLSRSKEHCPFEKLIEEEEGISNGLLNTAIRTFLLDENNKNNNNNQKGRAHQEYSKIDDILEEELLWESTKYLKLEGINKTNKTISSSDDNNDGGNILYSSLIPNKNNVFLVSYESIMRLEDEYIEELYKALGIKSNHRVTVKFQDGNRKYYAKKVNNETATAIVT